MSLLSHIFAHILFRLALWLCFSGSVQSSLSTSTITLFFLPSADGLRQQCCDCLRGVWLKQGIWKNHPVFLHESPLGMLALYMDRPYHWVVRSEKNLSLRLYSCIVFEVTGVVCFACVCRL